VHNTRYARVFHSSQWSNYDLSFISANMSILSSLIELRRQTIADKF